MIKSIKSFLPALLITALFSLNSCGSSTDFASTTFDNQQVSSQSFFGNNGKVPDNDDINIKIDNQILSRRTYNNAPATFYIDGVSAYPAMEEMIDSAKKTLYVETFIWRDDETGRLIAEKLAAKKREGVDVKVLVDSVGLKDQSTDKRIFDYMVAQKLDVHKFNKAIFSTSGINITHRKLIIADGDKAITGGMNFGAEYENEWHDSMTEVHGEVVQEIQREFFYDWQRDGGKMPAHPPVLVQGKVYGNIPMRVLVTSPHESNKKFDFKKALLAMVDNAISSIRLETPYLSDDDLILHLTLARQKGVKIETVIPKSADLKAYNYINLGTAKTLLDNSVNVFFYQPRFTHVKAAVIDNMALVGSANLDRRSMEENQELNLVIEDPEFIRNLNSDLFDQDIAQSSVENLSTVKVSFLKKLAVTATEILDYYL